MKLIILGAGYATRLYPLTLNQPKPLLEVAGKPMIEHVLDNLKAITDIDHIYIVTNARFAGHFAAWADAYRTPHPGAPVTVIDDRSTDDSNKLGAIGDLNLVLTEAQIDNDIIVVAGDNLFSNRLENFGEFCRARDAPVVGVYDVGNLDEIKKYNAIEIDDADQITFFEEKPAHPKEHVDRDRFVLLSEVGAAADSAVSRRRQPRRSAGVARAVALPAHAFLRLARAGDLV